MKFWNCLVTIRYRNLESTSDNKICDKIQNKQKKCETCKSLNFYPNNYISVQCSQNWKLLDQLHYKADESCSGDQVWLISTSDTFHIVT